MIKYTLILFIATYFSQLSVKLYAQDWTIIREDNPILSMKSSKDELVMVITDKRISWYDLRGNISKTLTIQSEGNITRFFEDKNGVLWFGTDQNSISTYDGSEWKSLFKAPNNYYNNSIITQIFQDKQKNMWFGTYGGGLVQFDGKNWIVHNNKNGHLSEDHISSIFQDWQGSVWFGTWDGLTKYSSDTWTKFYQKKEKQDNRSFYSIFQDRSYGLWFGTNIGLVNYDGKNWEESVDYNNKNPKGYINPIFQDKQGNIWFGTGINSGYVYRFDGMNWNTFPPPYSEIYIPNLVQNIVQDKQGNLWAGTLFGISKFENQKWVNVAYPPNEQKNGFNPRVTQILKDKNGSLWFGTNTGLILVNFEEEERIEEGIIYPNPATSTIEISGIPNDSKISIFNERGILLREVMYKDYLWLDYLSSGVYFLKIETGNTVFTKKFIIQK